MYQCFKQRPDISLCYCHNCTSKQLSWSLHGEQSGPNKDWDLGKYIGNNNEREKDCGKTIFKIIELIDFIWGLG